MKPLDEIPDGELRRECGGHPGSWAAALLAELLRRERERCARTCEKVGASVSPFHPDDNTGEGNECVAGE